MQRTYLTAVRPCFGTEPRTKYLVAAQACKKGMYECIVYRNHSSCTCPCFKYNSICKHSLCISEIEGIIQEHVDYFLKSPRRTQPFKSGLVKPSKDAQGKKGGRHNNPWRPSQDFFGRSTGPFDKIHHNLALVIHFLVYTVNADNVTRNVSQVLYKKSLIPNLISWQLV